MANITLLGASYTDVPAVDLPQTGGGTVRFYENGGGSSGYTRTVIAPQQTVTPDSNRQATLSGVTAGFVDASHYIVTLDGVEWYGTCETLWGNNLTVGEAQWFWTTPVDYVYPFGAIYVSDDGLTVAFADTSQHTIKVEKLELTGSGGGGDATLITKTITANGTYSAEDDNADGYSSVTVSVTPNLQSKSATPTTSSQTVSPDSGYDGLSSVTVGAIPSQYIVPTGNKAITENGNNIDVAEYATVSVNVSGSSKNVQVAQGVDRVATTSYTAVNGQSITVAVTGTYDVYWTGYRSSTSGTSGSQLYIGSTAYGSVQTTFSNNGQSVHLTGVSLTQGQVVTVRARARNTSSYMYVGNLTIVQTA